ncbi:MAG: type II toxin-antitoxin system prevent-host-death family antitoxin [Actinomycetaceae bacterium]|nr:type II toxin-antitoxin system prevent-host-death family antitoxin [Actinomycetaceae bacterium]
MASVTAQEFNRDVSAAKRMAMAGPVVVTDRGKDAFVLLNIAEYRRLTHVDVEDFLNLQRMDEDIDLEFPPMKFEPKIPQL